MLSRNLRALLIAGAPSTLEFEKQQLNPVTETINDHRCYNGSQEAVTFKLSGFRNGTLMFEICNSS